MINDVLDIANAFLSVFMLHHLVDLLLTLISFEGFYAREKGKSILGVGRPSKLGGRSAVGMEDEQSTASAHALVQAALLFPEDEEKRTECFEMALEEILKVIKTLQGM